MGSEKASRRYIIGDPSFVSFSGHCYEYMKSVADCLRNSGSEVVLAGNHGLNADVSAKTGALGVFSHWCDHRPVPAGVDVNSSEGREIVRRVHEHQVKEDLEIFDRNIKFTSQDVLVLNTFRHWALRGIVDWLESLNEERVPRVILLLHFTASPVLGQPINDTQMYKDAFRRIEVSRYRGRFVLLADAEELVSEYRAISDLDFELAPIPHTKDVKLDDDFVDNPSIPLTITYAGEARINKGFHFLPYVVDQFEEGNVSRSYRFEIQNFIHDRNAIFYRLAMSKLKWSSKCAFLDYQLNDEEYDEFLNRSDIVLVPYLTDSYHSQTSGIYAEAVSMGKPVVVPMGTWMAAQVRKYGGGVTFPPGDQRGLYEATIELVENYTKYKREAISAAKKWREFHTAKNLISMF